MKVIRNSCDKELGCEMKSANENYLKSSLKRLQKSLPLRGIYVNYIFREKQYIGVYSL